MLCIIQARASSKRLPGKILMEIAGVPLLERVVERVSEAQCVSKLIVATSNDKTDDQVVELCKKNNVQYFRGSLFDVASRYREIANREETEGFIRISGDSPLIDSKLIDRAINYFQLGELDLVTNVFPRSFPKGQSVEVIRTDIFIENYKKFSEKVHYEHVTKFFYDNFKMFRIFSFTSGFDMEEINLSVDSAEDIVKLEKLIKKSKSKSNSWYELANNYQLL